TVYVGSVLQSQDVRPFRTVLNSHLRPEFARLLKYDDDDTGASALAASIARIYWNIGSDIDRDLVRGYRWGGLLMVESTDSSELTSPLIGRCAVDMLRESGKLDDPQDLYRRGHFKSCALLLETLGRRTPHRLLIAAQMLSEAFGDETDGLYFSDSV